MISCTIWRVAVKVRVDSALRVDHMGEQATWRFPVLGTSSWEHAATLSALLHSMSTGCPKAPCVK